MRVPCLVPVSACHRATGLAGEGPADRRLGRLAAAATRPLVTAVRPLLTTESTMILLNPLKRSVHYRDGLPILPGAFPLVGHVPALLTDAEGLLGRARAELGPMFWMTMGPGMWVIHCMGLPALEIL